MNAFSQSILDWYRENGRDLPWRRTRDPYAVWLSEIILQQTRVAQGTAYWHRFLERFPTVEDLAAASEDEVLRLWEGLGYYSRARNLHAAARQIAALGAFPRTLEGIRALKGVGDYTAAAIGSICFGLPAAVVDGNVYRVLARHFGIATPVGTTEARKEFTALAGRLLPEQEASAFNQGMMDFGALQCTPANPACLTCPVQASCQALRSGRVELLPVKKAPGRVQERHFAYIYLRVDGYTAIRRRGAGDIWQGLYEPLVVTKGSDGLTDWGTNPPDPPGRFAPDSSKGPFPEGISDWGTNPPDPLGRFAPDSSKGPFPSPPVLMKAGVKHQLTHRTLVVDFYRWEPAARPKLPDGYVWIPEAELDRYAKPRLFELLLDTYNNNR